LIAEFVPDDDRRGPLMPLLFALHMSVLTDHGDAFTLVEYKKWLMNAGFVDVRTVAAPAPSPLILATKPYPTGALVIGTAATTPTMRFLKPDDGLRKVVRFYVQREAALDNRARSQEKSWRSKEERDGEHH